MALSAGSMQLLILRPSAISLMLEVLFVFIFRNYCMGSY